MNDSPLDERARRKVRAGDIMEARLSPAVTDDLLGGAEIIWYTGERLRWTAVRRVEDSPHYDGQWRMELGDDDGERLQLWWAPLCDLVDIVTVGFDQRAADVYSISCPDEPQ